MLSDEEKAVLKTAKENYGLTSAEQKILVNLIEKQQKEIKRLKIKNNDLLRKLRNRIKDVKKLQKYGEYKKEFSTLNKRIKKQDGIINEMAKFIENNSAVDYFCNKENCYADDYVDGHCEKCLKCIKEYFEKKMEEE